MKLRYFSYCRKSTESEERQVLSIPSQESELEARFGNDDSVEIVFSFTESMSAKAPGRPVFDEMIRRITNGEADGIITWHPDRLARNSIDGGRIIYLLDAGILKDLKFPNFTFENTPQGKFMLAIFFADSKYYVDNLSENVKRGNRKKVELGWRPNWAPPGYLNEKETKTTIPDPDRFRLVRRIYDEMLSGSSSPASICRAARDDWGLRTLQRKKKGGNPIAISGIYRILKNPFYAGIIEWGGKTYSGKHVPMVTLDEFERVQELLGRAGRPRPKKRHFAYVGLMRCGSCGLSITAEEKVNRHGSRYTYYHCTRRHRPPGCRQPSIEVRALEEQLGQFLRGVALPDELHAYSLAELEKDPAKQADRALQEKQALQRALGKLEEQLGTLTKLRLRDGISDSEFDREREVLRREKLRLSERLTNHRATQEWFEPFETFLSFSNRAADWFEHGDEETKRLIMLSVCSNPILIDKKLSIQAAKPFRVWPATPSDSYLPTAVEDVRTLLLEPEFLQRLSYMREVMKRFGVQSRDEQAA